MDNLVVRRIRARFPIRPLRQEVEGSMGEGKEWSVGMSIWIGDVWNSIHMRE